MRASIHIFIEYRCWSATVTVVFKYCLSSLPKGTSAFVATAMVVLPHTLKEQSTDTCTSSQNCHVTESQDVMRICATFRNTVTQEHPYSLVQCKIWYDAIQYIVTVSTWSGWAYLIIFRKNVTSEHMTMLNTRMISSLNYESIQNREYSVL